MGFRTGPLISPALLRSLVLPWHKKFAALAHGRGLPYFLHSCGNLASIMPDLIDDVGIDGKHSYEDAILPAEEFQARWGSRIAVLGGVDINILSKGTEEDVRRRTRRLIETCGARGRYAVGSGNSIPSYIPPAIIWPCSTKRWTSGPEPSERLQKGAVEDLERPRPVEADLAAQAADGRLADGQARAGRPRPRGFRSRPRRGRNTSGRRGPPCPGRRRPGPRARPAARRAGAGP